MQGGDEIFYIGILQVGTKAYPYACHAGADGWWADCGSIAAPIFKLLRKCNRRFGCAGYDRNDWCGYIAPRRGRWCYQATFS